MNLEEMKLALQALELCNGAETADGIIIYTDKEIASLRQAIKAAEKQEPVAYWNFNSGFIHCMIDQLNEAAKHNPAPLYTAPPKREWVGLTDEKIEAIGKDDKVLLAQFHTSVKGIDEMKDPTAQIMNLVIRQQGFNFAKAIEAELREKNA